MNLLPNEDIPKLYFTQYEVIVYHKKSACLGIPC